MSSYVRSCVLVMALMGLGATVQSVKADSPPTLSNAAFFDCNTVGANINTIGGTISHGEWTTVLGQQNVPGNYGYNLFLTKVASPTPSDFLTPALTPSISLDVGVNTIYYFADGNDPQGGTNGFGLNLYFNAAAANSPSISAFRLLGAGQSVQADGSSSTASYDYKVIPGTNHLSFISGNYQVTMSDFVVTAVGTTLGTSGGGTSTVDLVNSTNTAPFSPPAHADGIMDTYGQFTLTVTAVPEVSSLSILGMAMAASIVRRPKKNLR